MNLGLLSQPPAPIFPSVQKSAMSQQEVVGNALVETICTILELHGVLIALIQVVPLSAVQVDANCITALPLFGLVGVLAIGSYFEYPKMVAKTPVLVSANE